MYTKLKSFISYDLRTKILKLEEASGIKLYPNLFNQRGFKSIITRVYFLFFFIEKIFKNYKKKKSFLFNSNFENILFISTFPRSGSTFLKNLIFSYIEIKFKIGSGVPKYDNETDEFKYTYGENIYLDIYTLVNSDKNNLSFLNRNIKSNKNNLPYIYFSHYPLSRIDLVHYNKFKKEVILIRDPVLCCISYLKFKLNIFKNLNKNKITNEHMNIHMDKTISDLKIFFLRVKKIKSDKTKLFIKYENLVLKTNENLKKILNHFNIAVDKNVISKVVKNNIMNKTKKMVYVNNFSTNRFSNYKLSKIHLKKFKKKIFYELKNEIELYNNL